MTNSDILRLRVLLSLRHAENGGEYSTVTGIARILGEEKYTISRVVSVLEKQGYVDKTKARMPKLTPTGRAEAEKYAKRVEIIQNHLLYEGLDSANARRDAYYWALYNSEETMEVIRSTDDLYRMKYEIRDNKRFKGEELCKHFKDGIYKFPFLVYREHILDGNILSMANEGFENPCTLKIEKGIGTLQLRRVKMTVHNKDDGKKIQGKVSTLSYFSNGMYIPAEISGDLIMIPLSALNFVNCGTGSGQVLHGTVPLKMQCQADGEHMPESGAVFAVMI